MEGTKGKRPLSLGPFTFLPLFAAALAIAARLPFWCVALLFALMFLGAAWHARRQRIAALLSLLALEPRSISAVTPEVMEIELSNLAREKITPGDSFPPYVHRGREDDRIRSCLKQHRFVVVDGNRYAGKTRAALEAIRSGREGKVLLLRRASEGDNPLRELLSQPWLIPKRSRCFVFIDKLDTYLDGLDPHDIDSWLAARPRAALVATISHKARRAALDSSSADFDRNKQILHESKIARLKDAIGGKALARAQAIYGTDPELARIGACLGGGPVIEGRYTEAEADQPVAWGIATAAVTAARAGLMQGVKQNNLIELAKRLGLVDRFTPTEELARAIDFCCEETEGILGLLIAEEPDEGQRRLRANSVLVRAVSESTGQRPAPMPLATWVEVAQVLAEDQRSCVEIARGAWLQSLGKGSDDKELMELALELLWSEEAQHRPEPEVGRLGINLEAAIIEELESEGSSPRRPQPFGPPHQIPTPDPAQVEEVIDRRGVTGEDSLFEPELPAYWNPPPFYANRAKRDALRCALLLGLDFMAAAVGILIGSQVTDLIVEDGQGTKSIFNGAVIAIPLLWVLFAYLGLYRPDSKRAKLPEIVNGMTIASFVLGLVALAEGFEPEILLLILFGGVAASCAVFFTRAVYDWGSGKWVKRRKLRSRTLFVAPVESAHLSADLVRQTSRRPMQFVGFVSRDEAADPAQLSTLVEFEQVLTEFFVDRVILADPKLTPEHRSELVTICHTKGVKLELFPSPDEIFQEAGEALADLSVPLIGIPPPYLGYFSARFKRAFDLVLGTFFCLPALLFGLPLAALLWAVNVGRTPISEVPRLGRKRRGFSMYRFHLTADHPLAQSCNALLRRTHLQKLPQLYNVLRGEMSLVGPRPLTGREFSQLNEVERHRYAVKPGITGLWQVTRRNEPVRDQFARIALMASLDLVYCRRWSPLLDFTILLRTPGAFIRDSEPRPEEDQG